MRRALIPIAAMPLVVALSGQPSPAQEAPQAVKPAAKPQQAAKPQPAAAVDQERAAAKVAVQPHAGQAINIKVEATISDQRGSAAPVKKTLTLVVGDGLDGMVRSDTQFSQGSIGIVPLHMDASPAILPDGKIRVRFSLQYDMPHPAGSDTAGSAPGALYAQKTAIQERLTLVLENGKPVVATQSADPVSDRQVTVEVKATILK